MKAFQRLALAACILGLGACAAKAPDVGSPSQHTEGNCGTETVADYNSTAVSCSYVYSDDSARDCEKAADGFLSKYSGINCQATAVDSGSTVTVTESRVREMRARGETFRGRLAPTPAASPVPVPQAPRPSPMPATPPRAQYLGPQASALPHPGVALCSDVATLDLEVTVLYCQYVNDHFIAGLCRSKADVILSQGSGFRDCDLKDKSGYKLMTSKVVSDLRANADPY